MTLPQVAGLNSAIFPLGGSFAESATAEDLASLLPTVSNFKTFVKKVAREQRRVDDSRRSDGINSVWQETLESWGDPRNRRCFERTASGCAFYEFRTGETLRSVVMDLLVECKKSYPSICHDYQAIRSAMQDILTFNNLSDPDFISPGSKLMIPSSLVPVPKFAA